MNELTLVLRQPESEEKGGRPSKGKLSIDLALKMYDSKEYSIRQILDASKLSKTTFYRYLNKRNA
ncbi:hypothetical protein EfsSVR2330_32790 (plasmid) [Enterococcus faecalis]|nr:hypothetical protein EfsSVR2330_32790 [Enterococcus faecalis]